MKRGITIRETSFHTHPIPNASKRTLKFHFYYWYLRGYKHKNDRLKCKYPHGDVTALFSILWVICSRSFSRVFSVLFKSIFFCSNIYLCLILFFFRSSNHFIDSMNWTRMFAIVPLIYVILSFFVRLCLCVFCTVKSRTDTYNSHHCQLLYWYGNVHWTPWLVLLFLLLSLSLSAFLPLILCFVYLRLGDASHWNVHHFHFKWFSIKAKWKPEKKSIK